MDVKPIRKDLLVFFLLGELYVKKWLWILTKIGGGGGKIFTRIGVVENEKR